MKKPAILILSIISIAVVITILFISFRPRRDIKIGFIADLSGRQSQLGIAVRNSFLMAIDELNASGGINRHKITALIEDNENNRDISFEKTKKLVSENVDVIIGPMTSAMAGPVIKAAENTVIISPTVSTDAVTGIDDMFFRVIPAASMQGKKLADIVIKNNEKNIIVVLDSRNIEYSGAFSKGFLKKFEAVDGNTSIVIEFNDKSQFPEIAQKIKEINPVALIFISSGINAAGIIQQYAKIAPLPHLYSSYWGKASNVHEFGGRTVEGMILVAGFENEIETERERDFHKKYFDIYQTVPNFAARYSYESVMLYAAAAGNAKSLKPLDIKKELLQLESFEGITDSYKMDPYGDVIRDQTLFIIKDNQYEFY